MAKKKISSKVINKVIDEFEFNKDEISDGFHTFGELYAHRTVLYIALCKYLKKSDPNIFIWKSNKNSDGSEYEGYFLLGINKEKGKQISYHLEKKYLNDCDFAKDLPIAPEFDGHNSNDVLGRIMKL